MYIPVRSDRVSVSRSNHEQALISARRSVAPARYATDEELNFIACELVHICPRSCDAKYGSSKHKVRVAEDKAMPRIPEWLTVDLMIIAAGTAIVGAIVLIAP